MQLTSRETNLLNAFRQLPTEAAEELSALVERLADFSGRTKVDWSDSWSDQDLQEFTAHSLRRHEDEEE